MIRSLYALLLTGLSAPLLAQPGTLDATFGIGGVVEIDMSVNPDRGTDLLPLADGRIWVCGHLSPSLSLPEPFLLRLLPDGTLDPDPGIVILPHSFRGRAEKMVYAADSSIYLCGYADSLGADCITLWHMLSDGTPDQDFGMNGRISLFVSANLDRRALDIAMQSDGKLVISGYQQISSRNSFLARFHPDGSQDSTFGYNGSIALSISSNAADELLTIDVLDDGSIVAGGYGTSAGQEYPVIVKLTPGGLPDSTFYDDGIWAPMLSSSEMIVTSLTVMGQSVVAGGARHTGLITTSDYFLIRFDGDGVLDTSFGTLGEEMTDVNIDDYISDLTVLADGRIAVTGHTGDVTNNEGYLDLLTAVHTIDGAPYIPYGGSGNVITQISASVAQGHAVKAQPDGKLVVAGFGGVIGNGSLVVLRFNNDLLTTAPAMSAVTPLTLWPNPATDRVWIKGDTPGSLQLEVLDGAGRVVLDPVLSGQQTRSFDIHGLADGHYLLRCVQGDFMQVLPLQVAH